jgi:hypothetical protein
MPVKSVKYAAVASVLAIVIALAVSACGGSSTTTVTAQPTQTAGPTTTTPTTTTTSSTATTSTTGSTTTTAGPSACGPDQAFSQVSHTCVNTRSGGNPCPKGQVPMADRPVCVSKQE